MRITLYSPGIRILRRLGSNVDTLVPNINRRKSAAVGFTLTPTANVCGLWGFGSGERGRGDGDGWIQITTFIY